MFYKFYIILDEIIADRLRIEEEKIQRPDVDLKNTAIKRPSAVAPESNTEIT
jgi:hypothetical protein